MTLVVTEAGLAAVTQANEQSIQLKLTHIGLGTSGYKPNAGQTSLKNEVVRKAIDFGDVLAAGHLRFGVQFDGELNIDVKEIGYYLEDGTLFAIESRGGEVISIKRPNTVTTEYFELLLKGQLVSAITVEVGNHPFANETTPGIIRIATGQEVAEGRDDTAALTIKKMLLRTATLERAGVTRLSSAIDSDSQDMAATSFALKKLGMWVSEQIEEAVSSLLPTSGGTVAGDLTVNGILKEKGQRVYSPNNKPSLDELGAVTNLTNLGKTDVSFVTVTDANWWGDCGIGHSQMLRSDSVGIPQTETGGYAFKMSARDVEKGHAWLYLDSYGAGGNLWYGAHELGTESPVWAKLYSTRNKPTATDIGLSNVHNWTASSSIDSTSETQYATVHGSKKAADVGRNAQNQANNAVNLANNAHRRADDAWNRANQALNNAVYTGQDWNNADFPIGTTVSAFSDNYHRDNMNKHKTLWVCSTPEFCVFISSDFGNVWRGRQLAGTWAVRGITGAWKNVHEVLFERVF